MSYSFAIIGGGWYGCHIATSLRALGFGVTLFEQNNRLLHEASGNNQFRLHQGFHYPRHYATRMQSRDGFSRFVERYPGLSRPVAENLYAVPRGDSLIDFLTYRIIMTSSGIDFSELPETPPGLANIEGCLKATERVLLTGRARSYFADRLGADVVLGQRVEAIQEHGNAVRIDGKRFDFAIDATWGHYRKPPIDLYYEPTLLLYYEANAPFPAVTMVDGPLCSVYPTEDSSIFTLSSVPYTPLGRFDTAAAARAALSTVDTATVTAKRAEMEQQIARYIPDFRGTFSFMGPQLSIKTKPTGAYDDRSCHVYQQGRVFSVMSGKIDTIFFAVERILSMIEAMPEATEPLDGGSLREEIMRKAASPAPA
jgi:glycine/D-amino acid oxidase-like deaminating enzyme